MRLRAVATAATVALVLSGCMAASSRPPECEPSSAATILLAQSVPSATRVPCLRELPLGWRFGGMRVTDAGAEMWLSTNTGGVEAVTITFSASCDVGDAEPVNPTLDEAGADVFVDITSTDPVRGVRYRRFEGGCLTTRYAFPAGSPTTLVREADEALSHVSRFRLVHHVSTDDGAILCGADAPPCEDG
ncbi:MAG TPA: hypothetical protein VLA82_08390 [Actinomycetota bacterium]|nr:hypothetical protein [Actinomycetota bacterium]